MIEKDIWKDALKFQLQKHVTMMFKAQLEMLDFLSDEQGMDDKTKQRYRKLFLANGNETIRVLLKEVDKYSIDLDNI